MNIIVDTHTYTHTHTHTHMDTNTHTHTAHAHTYKHDTYWYTHSSGETARTQTLIYTQQAQQIHETAHTQHSTLSTSQHIPVRSHLS